MSEERAIRINKVLRELNISLERAVDYLKEKDHNIDASPNAKISQAEYDILCGQFSADKGKKVASIEVGEEKRKEKEALKKELEKEVEEKRLLAEKQKLEVIKAKSTLSGPKTIGKIDLDPKKSDKVVVKTSEKSSEKPVEIPKQETKDEPALKQETQPVEATKEVKEKPVSEKVVKENKTVKVEKTENTNEVKLSFEIEAEKFDEAMKKVYLKTAKYFNVPGFRKGKAPMQMVEKQYGASIFYEDTFNELVPEIYDEAIKANNEESAFFKSLI